jgi:hypothetical protein
MTLTFANSPNVTGRGGVVIFESVGTWKLRNGATHNASIVAVTQSSTLRRIAVE